MCVLTKGGATEIGAYRSVGCLVVGGVWGIMSTLRVKRKHPYFGQYFPNEFAHSPLYVQSLFCIWGLQSI